MNPKAMTLSKTKESILSQLNSKKMRKKYGIFLVEGDKCVSDTLGAFEALYIVATSKWIETHADFIGGLKTDVFEASARVMSRISSLSTPPEVIAVMRLPEQEPWDLELKKGELHLLLDGIQDPGNLGTIIRTADWFGFTVVYASQDTVDVFNPKVIQATMGSLKRVKVVYTNLVDLVKSSGISKVYGMMLDGSDIFKEELSNEGIIVMGNEGNGLSEGIRKTVNRKLLIPPYDNNNHGDSLNVGIATGITLAQFRSQSNQ